MTREEILRNAEALANTLTNEAVRGLIQHAYIKGAKDNAIEDNTVNVEMVTDPKTGEKYPFVSYKDHLQKPWEWSDEDENIRQALILLVSNDKKNGYTEFYKAQEITCDKAISFLKKLKQLPTNEEMLRTLRVEYEKGVADTIAKYEQKEQKPVKSRSVCIESEHDKGCKEGVKNALGKTEDYTIGNIYGPYTLLGQCSF